MKRSTFIAMVISIFMMIFGLFQTFFIDPEIRPYTSSTFLLLFRQLPAVILSLLITGFSAFFCKIYIDTGGTFHKIRQKLVDFQPPTKEAFGLLMLTSFVFSALGTFTHDLVMLGLGILFFILPVFLDPYIGRHRKPRQPKGLRRGINWEMISAIIAFVTLIWVLLTHYGLVP